MLITASGTKSVPSQIVNMTKITQPQNNSRFLPNPRTVKIAAFFRIRKPDSRSRALLQMVIILKRSRLTVLALVKISFQDWMTAKEGLYL